MRIAERLSEFFRRVRMLFSRRQSFDRELEEEMLLHRELRAQELGNNSTGEDANAEAAGYASQRRFGNMLRLREEIHEAWGFTWVDNLRQDLRYGFRRLRKSPGFTSVVVFTLALGIGANTAIFSVVYAVLLRSLPYPHPQQLVNVFENNLGEGVKATGCSYQDFKELQQSGALAGAAGVQRHDLTLTGAGDPRVVATVVVTPEIFPLLAAAPLAGRYFLSQDNEKGSPPAVLLSEGLWRTRFGGDSHMVGRSIMLDQQAFTVVGIMPASFRVPVFGAHQEIWIPVVHDPLFGPWMPKRGGHWLRVVGRLNSGVTLAGAQSQADAVSRRLAAEFPEDNTGWALRLAPLQAAIVGNVRAPLLVLLGAVGLVLLLACVNIANLLVARATFRRRELAVRQALGAKPGRIIRQLLVENAILGLLGAIVGLVLAGVSTSALSSLLPADAPSAQPVQLDGAVLGFAVLLSLAASIGFGLAPALLAARSDVQANLKDGSARSGSDRGGLRLRSFLTGAEVSLAMVLVIAAGLLVRSLIAMTSADPGFSAAHVLKAEVSLPRYQYTTPQQWTAFSNSLLERIQAEPGMQDSAFAVPLPMADGFVNLKFSIADGAPVPPGMPETADYVSVSPKYFHVMGVPLLRGRNFTPEDSPSAPLVTIISEQFARQYFREQNPLGKKLIFGFPLGSNMPREIVGVVAGVRDAGLKQAPEPMMYVPFAQAPFWGGDMVVKSTLPPAIVLAGIHQAVASLDKNLPITDVAMMSDVLSQSVAQPRFRTWLLSAFGIVALLLAAAGVFGVVSYSVASRTKEFGVRAAIGASPGSIGNLVLLEGLRLAAVGLGCGALLALGLARFLKSEIFGVAAYDPLTFLTAALVLLLAALIACYVPARRAMRVDPMVALRYE